MLSENLTQANVRAYLTAQGFSGIGGGRFFINGVDTTTKGVDIVANFKLPTETAGTFNVTLGANFNNTDVTKVPTTAQLSALNPAPILFDRVNVLTFERGTPSSKFSGSVDWTKDAFGASARVTRYGTVLSPGTAAASDFTMQPAIVVDIDSHWDVTSKVRVTLGADNLFDQYPEALPASLNTTSNTPFSNYAPYGRSGRYVYGRVAYSW